MKIYLCIFLFFISASAFTQPASRDTLSELLKNKRNYNQIEQIIGNYYQNRPQGRGTGYNQWLRWLWFNRTRLDQSGNITNPAQRAELALLNYNNSMGNFGNNFTAAGIPTWQSIGPTNYTSLANDYLWGLGRIDRVAFHPADANIFYAGTAMGGLWGTQNGGTSWQHLTAEIPLQSISGVVCSYSDANTLYILTGDGEATGYFNYMDASASTGIYKSTNAGATWSKVHSFSTVNPTRGYQLVQHPTNPETLYACTSTGFILTVNGGQTWTQRTIAEKRDLVFHPLYPDIAYADGSNSNVILYHMPNDTTFVNINTNITGGSIQFKQGIAIAVSANEPNTVMIIAGKTNGTLGADFEGLYKGTLAYNFTFPNLSTLAIITVRTTPNILGGHVLGTDPGGQATYDLGIALNPSDATKLVTAGLCVWKSTDQGVSNMTAATEYFSDVATTTPYIHPDVHKVVYNPLNNYLYALSDGGIYVSTDNGGTWTEKTKTMSITQYYNISGAENYPNLILGGTQDNGTFYRKSTSFNFKRVRGADGFSTAINPKDTSKIYWTENHSLKKSTSGGNNHVTIKNFTNTSFSAGSFPEIRLNPDYPDTLVAFTYGIMEVSKNGGSTWNVLYPSGIRDFSFCMNTFSKALFLTGAGEVKVCNDIFAAAPVVTSTLSVPPGGSYFKIATFPTSGELVWIGAGNYAATNRVMFSGNGGTTPWTDITGTLPALPINCMAADANGYIYVGTDIGIFVRGLGDADWTPYSNGLPRVAVTGLVINNSSGLLTASTLGLGVYRTNLFSSCSATENLSGFYEGQYYFQASSSVGTTATISESAGTNVVFKAGSHVVLSPGFLAKRGGDMRAIIGPCNSGIPSIIGTSNQSRNVFHKKPLELSQDKTPETLKVKKSGKITTDK